MAKDNCLLGAVHGAEDRFQAILQAEVEFFLIGCGLIMSLTFFPLVYHW